MIILFRVFVIFTIFLLPLSIFGDSHNKQNNCAEDNIATLYDLIYGNYLPFEPPLDEEGNISVSPEELFVMKSKHFFNQIKKVEPVKISLATYASLSKEVPQALSDFETRIKIILPDCQIISLFRGSPIEKITTDFETAQLVSKMATDANLNSLMRGNDSLLTTKHAFRDITAWHHIVLRIDTTQSTQANRVRMYLNGQLLEFYDSSFFSSGDYPGQNETIVWNQTDPIRIGSYYDGSLPFDGYFAEFIMADGQSYAPTQFGETKNGVWIPKDPSGTTFGTNGFHLKFANASSLGTDSSGNGNDFSVNNMGTDHKVLDSPTFG